MGYLSQRIETCCAIAGADHTGSMGELRHELEYLESFTLGLLGETPDGYAALDLVGKFAEQVASALRGRPVVAGEPSSPQQVSDGGATVGDLVNGVVENSAPASGLESIDLGDAIETILWLVGLFGSLEAQSSSVPDDLAGV